MPSFYVEEVNIDADEFLSACTDSEIKELVDALIKDQYLQPSSLPSQEHNRHGVPEQLYEEALNKLHNKWNRLSKEDEEFVMGLAAKF